MARFDGRTALVTGGSRGIGKATVLRLASEGSDVAINYASSVDAAQAVCDEVRAMGRKSEIYQADVANANACETAVTAALSNFGAIDILVNNAGIGSAAINRPAIADATDEQWQLLLGANLYGPVNMCRLLVPHMRAAERSDVIVISSIAAQALNPGFGVYSVSKAAVEAMAHTLAREEKKHGMRVNIIAPGLVDTDMGRRIVGAIGGDKDLSGVAERSPFGFVCMPEDIAATVAHLCAEDGRYITNQRITISGD